MQHACVEHGVLYLHDWTLRGNKQARRFCTPSVQGAQAPLELHVMICSKTGSHQAHLQVNSLQEVQECHCYVVIAQRCRISSGRLYCPKVDASLLLQELVRLACYVLLRGWNRFCTASNSLKQPETPAQSTCFGEAQPAQPSHFHQYLQHVLHGPPYPCMPPR